MSAMNGARDVPARSDLDCNWLVQNFQERISRPNLLRAGPSRAPSNGSPFFVLNQIHDSKIDIDELRRLPAK